MEESVLKKYPFVSIIFPCWNHKNDTLECLDSLEKIDYPKERMEIIVADNGSMDGSQDSIKDKFKQMAPRGWSKLILIENKVNLGHSAGTNRAYEKTSPKAKYILKLDNDVTLASDSLIKSVKEMEKNSDIGLLGAKILNYYNPDAITQTTGAVFWDFFFGKSKLINSLEPIYCDHVTGCYALVRKKAIGHNFFDEKFFVYGDDVDFSLRIKRKGFKVLYLPKVKVWHKVSVSTGASGSSAFAIYYCTKNKLRLEKKWGKLYHKLFFYPFFFFILTPRFLIGRIVRGEAQKIPAYFKAIKSFYLNL